MDEVLRCEDVEPLVDAFASGQAVPAAAEAHLRSCAACASALELARRIDHLLQIRPAPAAPDRFTGTIFARLHRDRWRSEQFVDWGFNIAVAAGLALMAGGAWLFLNISGMTALTADIASAVSASGEALLPQFHASLPLYGSSALLLVTALGVWWWADRRVSL